MRTVFILVLASPAFCLPRYDPDADRFAFKGAANASYVAAVAAYRAPLMAERAAEIRADLDEAVKQAGLAADAARKLDGAAQGRAADMKGAVKDAAKDLPAAPADLRARWKTLTSARSDLGTRVDNMPDKNPDGSPNSDKSALKDELSQAEASLKTADTALIAAESAAKGAADAAAQMQETLNRAVFDYPYGELLQADSDGLAQAGRLPGTADEAKSLVGLIDVEPKNDSRQKAIDKLSAASEEARQLFSAADRAANRADTFRALCREFDRALAALTAAEKNAAAVPAAAKAALDDADRKLADVRGRLH